MRKLVIATRNEGKTVEIARLLTGLSCEVISLQQFKNMAPVEEDSPTFAGNAVKKATAVARFTGELALADDSGLEVEALNGKPGVLSARFAGPGAGDEANNRLLLKMLREVPAEKRGAVFKCAVAIVFPGGATYTVEEACKGRISETLRGDGGFGYDPLFIFEESGLTFAEMDLESKNRVSHRGKAMRGARHLLEQLLDADPS